MNADSRGSNQKTKRVSQEVVFLRFVLSALIRGQKNAYRTQGKNPQDHSPAKEGLPGREVFTESLECFRVVDCDDPVGAMHRRAGEYCYAGSLSQAPQAGGLFESFRKGTPARHTHYRFFSQ